MKTLTERLEKIQKQVNRALETVRTQGSEYSLLQPTLEVENGDLREIIEERDQQLVYLGNKCCAQDKVIEILHNDLDTARTDVAKLRAQLNGELPVTPEKA